MSSRRKREERREELKTIRTSGKPTGKTSTKKKTKGLMDDLSRLKSDADKLQEQADLTKKQQSEINQKIKEIEAVRDKLRDRRRTLSHTRRAAAPDSPVGVAQPYIDALGEAERGVGAEAMQQVEGSLPGVYRESRRDIAAEALERYETFWERRSRDIYGRRAGLLDEAARLKTSEPTTRIMEPPNVFIDAVGGVEREAGAEADRRIAESMTRAHRHAHNVAAGLTYGAAQALGAVGGFFEGATTPLRPYRYPQFIRDIADPEIRAAIARDIKMDPTKYLVGLPSAYVGGAVTGRAISRIAKRVGITKPQATGEFVEVTETRGTAPSDWFDSKRLPKGTWSKAKSWGPPGEGGYLDTVLVPRQITRTVFVPKVTWPTWETPFGLTSAATFLTQIKKAVPQVSPAPPLTVMEQRQPQAQQARTRTRTGVVTLPTILPKIEPVIKQRDIQTPWQLPRQTPRQTQIQLEEQITLPVVPQAVTQLLKQSQTPVYGPKPTQKRRKKKGRKRRAAAERRLDPLAWTFPEVKVPEIATPKMEDVELKIEVPKFG